MDDVTSEHWRWVRGAETFYRVSDAGCVWSRPRQGTGGGLLPLRPDKRGYPIAMLVVRGVRKQRPVHQLVVEAFIGPRPDGLEVRHLDGNPANNRLGNLVYGTHAENMQDKLRHGTNHNSAKTHCKAGHEFTPDNTRTLYHPDGSVRMRQCRTCRREGKRKPPVEPRDCAFCGTSFTPLRRSTARFCSRPCAKQAA